MTSRDPGHGSRRSDELRQQIDADPRRRKLDLTQAALADRLNVTQENVLQTERGESDIRVSTLRRYVEALGGRLDMRATFPDHSVDLTVEKTSRTGKRKTGRAAVKRVSSDPQPGSATASQTGTG